ncbi:MAG TPA: hypothetical protein VLC74_10520 [Rhizomicrobium sp.]|nr:hypothetical protein [Rhizomicrobium sp.]
MRKPLFAALAAALLLTAMPARAAENPVGAAVRNLHLTPAQLLSLRDFLGGFSRGVQVDAAEGGLFVLRDQGSMAYTGEFALLVRGDGALQVDRITGPATLDLSRAVQLPVRLLAKARAQVMADVAASQMLRPAAAAHVEPEESAPASAMLPQPQLAGLKHVGSGGDMALFQARAIFFPDGSGMVAEVHASAKPPPAASQTPAPLRIVVRYYPAVRSDGARVWRDAVTEFDTDVPLRPDDLETRFACASTGPCAPPRGLPTPAGFHMIRWRHQLIAAVPPTLLAQLAPPPAAAPGPLAAAAPETSAAQNTPPPDSAPSSPPQL